MRRLLLSGDDWTLTGVWPNEWRQRNARQIKPGVRPICPPVPARVPGAVQLDLQRSGVIPDINPGLNSRQAEWTEHWDWIYTKRFTVPASFAGQRLFLEFAGLDYSGVVAIDGSIVGRFRGTHLPRMFEITRLAQPGAQVTLSVVFEEPPPLFGQLGATHSVKDYKPRFNYIWDWVARSVSTGIWDDVWLCGYENARLTNVSVHTKLAKDLHSGSLGIAAELDHYVPNQDLRLCWRLEQTGGEVVASGWQWVVHPRPRITAELQGLLPWCPAGWGGQPLYRLVTELRGEEGAPYDSMSFSLGFKHVRWLPNDNSPDSARPSLCCVNGQRVFLRGANWVPLSSYFGGVTREQYRRMLLLYRDMNVNLLRVWGGGILEKQDFYEVCDELGIFVWQEFPLSSGGISDFPPTDPEVIAELATIATSMVRRRGHHVSHLLWSGGNELAQGFDGEPESREVPVDEGHPLIGTFAQIVEECDPGKKFLPTSGHGPRTTAHPRDMGKGVHHDVHGPWAYLGAEAHYRYFNRDDALWRSEVGVPGYTSLALLEQNHGGLPAWPADDTNQLWLHHGSWWIGWELLTRVFGPWDKEDSGQLRQQIDCSRFLQAEGLRYVLEACRRRAFSCSLATIWMGHDCYWCTANNSVIEYNTALKPAYSAVQRAYAPLKVSLLYPRLYALPGEDFPIEVWALQDAHHRAHQGALTLRLRSLSGHVLQAWQEKVSLPENGSLKLLAQVMNVPQLAEGLFALEVELTTPAGSSHDVYLFGQNAEHPLAGLRSLPAATLHIVHQHRGNTRYVARVRNNGPVAAVMVSLVAPKGAGGFSTRGGATLIFPGEEAELEAAAAAGPLPELVLYGLNAVAF